MDTRVDQTEDPDGRRHETDTSPHAQHSTGMVIGLESAAALPLGEDDERVENLVKLGEVEDPAPEGEALVPEATDIGRVRQTVRPQANTLVVRVPDVIGGKVRHSIPEASGTMHLAQRIHGPDQRILLAVVRNCSLQRLEHGHACYRRIHRQEHIVQDDKGEEGSALADAPRLVSMLSVVRIDQRDRDGVDSCNGRRYHGVEGSLEDAGRYRERRTERRLLERRCKRLGHP